MATVKMIKGNKYADIFDSPETIAQARADGFELVKDEPVLQATKDDDADEKPAEKSEVKTPKTKRQ